MKTKTKCLLGVAVLSMLILSLYLWAYTFVFVVPRIRMHRMARVANEIVVRVHTIRGVPDPEPSAYYRIDGENARDLLSAFCDFSLVDGNFYSTSRELTVLALDREGKVIDSFYFRQLLPRERHRFREFIELVDEVKSGQKLTQFEIESLPGAQPSIFGRIELTITNAR